MSITSFKDLFPILPLTVLSLILFIFFLLAWKRYKEEKERYHAAEKQVKMMEDYCQNTLVKMDETRSLWHDIRKYILAIETLVAEDQIGDARLETRELRGIYEKLAHTVNTENEIINSILNYEKELAESKQIHLDMDIWLGKTLDIPATDLYIIIGNTLDNAIEACSELPEENEKTISVSLTQKNHMLFYKVINKFQKDQKPRTDKRFHGYGLRNVTKCVKKNQGSININEENGIYTLLIQLNV